MPGTSSITIELNPRERRLYDRLRGRIIETVPGTPSTFRDLLLVLPDLAILLGRLIRDRRVPMLHKGVAVAGMAYVLSPVDLMPALLFGPVGLVDDLFVVAACLSRLLNHVHPDVVREHWSGKGDALEVIQSVTSWSEAQLRRRVADLSRLLSRRRTSR